MMSSDNFDFEAWDGTIYPNLSASTYGDMQISKRLVEYMGERPGEPSDYTEYGTESEDLSSDPQPRVSLIDDLLDEIEKLRAALEFCEIVAKGCIEQTGPDDGFLAIAAVAEAGDHRAAAALAQTSEGGGDRLPPPFIATSHTPDPRRAAARVREDET